MFRSFGRSLQKLGQQCWHMLRWDIVCVDLSFGRGFNSGSIPHLAARKRRQTNNFAMSKMRVYIGPPWTLIQVGTQWLRRVLQNCLPGHSASPYIKSTRKIGCQPALEPRCYLRNVLGESRSKSHSNTLWFSFLLFRLYVFFKVFTTPVTSLSSAMSCFVLYWLLIFDICELFAFAYNTTREEH